MALRMEIMEQRLRELTEVIEDGTVDIGNPVQPFEEYLADRLALREKFGKKPATEKNDKKIDLDFEKLQRETATASMATYKFKQSDANLKAIAANKRGDYCTISNPEEDHPSGPVRTMRQTMKTQKHSTDDLRFAEAYDDAQWFRARAEFLENYSVHLEARVKFLEENTNCRSCRLTQSALFAAKKQ